MTAVAALQTLIDHHVTANAAVLGAIVTAGGSMLIEWLATTAATLTVKGLETAAANIVATNLLGRAVVGQSMMIDFDTAFNVVALPLVIAAPLLISMKTGRSRHKMTHAAYCGAGENR